ncbi:MAG: hypothetical protein K5893_01305 [Prevotella sp.]|nr:hypothetical protein [Prevotella sp.]
MKKILFISLLSLFTTLAMGQQTTEQEASADSSFIGKFVNDELNIFVQINFRDKNVTVNGQDILGELDGYFGCTKCQHVWPIVAAEVKGNVAEIDVINNHGSEDFVARMTLNDDGTITFRHLDGSTFKFPIPGKWHKIPSKVVFTPASKP